MEAHKSGQNPVVARMLEEWKRGMLPYWTLGLLLQRPMYGYEIRKEIERSTAGRLRLGVSTMPQLLRRLESKGFVNSRWEESPRGPHRAVYSITDAGRDVLRAYVDEVLSPKSPIFEAVSELTTQIFHSLYQS
jgi:PadR family transcriptional regulator, regulatory protein PadR